jgi:hypothetical protein
LLEILAAVDHAVADGIAVAKMFNEALLLQLGFHLA